MSSIRNILDIARRAMSAQETALNVTGHNIANANTDGYSRQRVLFETSRPLDMVDFLIGRGVEVNQIERVRNRYLDDQIWREQQVLSKWETREETLRQIEAIFQEPSENGLGDLLSQFWDSWHELANNPDETESRHQLQQKGIMLTNKFKHIATRLVNQQQNIEEEYGRIVSDINNITDQIAKLNREIVSIQANGESSGDLRDKRDLLVENLSKIVGIQVSEQANGSYNISLGGKVFVEQGKAVYVTEIEIADSGESRLVWEDGGTSGNPEGGSLGSLIELHDNIIPDFRQKLDVLATSLVSQVNSIHTTGYGLDGSTGNHFFNSETTGALDIELDSSVRDDVVKIAASADGDLGNGDIALSIGSLQDVLTMESDSTTFAGYYRSLIFSVGEATNESISVREGQELIVSQLENQRQSISGVSMDEEMTNLIKFQRAYQAAAKLVAVADEMTVSILEMV